MRRLVVRAGGVVISKVGARFSLSAEQAPQKSAKKSKDENLRRSVAAAPSLYDEVEES